MATKKERKKSKGDFKKLLGKLTYNKSVGQLVFKSVVMILVPYIYLYICGLIDSALLKAGFAFREAFILIVFFTLMAAWIAAVVLIIISIIKYRKSKKTES